MKIVYSVIVKCVQDFFFLQLAYFEPIGGFILITRPYEQLCIRAIE